MLNILLYIVCSRTMRKIIGILNEYFVLEQQVYS